MSELQGEKQARIRQLQARIDDARNILTGMTFETINLEPEDALTLQIEEALKALMGVSIENR